MHSVLQWKRLFHFSVNSIVLELSEHRILNTNWNVLQCYTLTLQVWNVSSHNRFQTSNYLKQEIIDQWVIVLIRLIYHLVIFLCSHSSKIKCTVTDLSTQKKHLKHRNHMFLWYKFLNDLPVLKIKIIQIKKYINVKGEYFEKQNISF